MKSKIISFLLALITVLGFAGCSDSSNKETTELKATHKAVINIENYGEIHLELYGDEAPVTVENFVSLANSKFYDGLTIHRIVPQFVIQGGDPNADGTGGSDKTIKGEFSANGHKNNISHTKGTISMARLSNNPNSATSQFFIVIDNASYLDGSYAAFGKVINGMEIVEKIANQNPGSNSNGGLVEAAKQPRIISVTAEKLY